MNRIDAKFSALQAAGQKGFVAYICAGDPDLKTTVALARELERVGVDVLELGIPFSDPLADGVVNQLAAERALASGTTLAGVLKMVAGLRRSGCQVPIVFYAYFNVLFHYGLPKFARDASAAGVDGVLALDLPPEEATDYEALIKQAGIHPIYLVAPTTPASRIRAIARHAAGFIYYVSREGVTSMQQTVAAGIGKHVAMIRKYTRLPIAVGFGVSTPTQAREVAAHADAVVVGSAIVNQIAKGRSPKAVAKFVASLVKAVKS